MPETAKEIIDLGIAGLLILALIGGWMEWWVYGPAHRRIVKSLTEDRNFWRTTALRALGVAEKAVPRRASDQEDDS